MKINKTDVNFMIINSKEINCIYIGAFIHTYDYNEQGQFHMGTCDGL